MFTVDRCPQSYNNLTVSADNLDEVIENIDKIISFLDSTYSIGDCYKNMNIHLSFTDNPVQLYGFLKQHATKKQLTELNKNTNFLIEELEWQLKDLEGNMFVV
jgi:cysteinyl-tRNA synthetase